MKYDITKYNRTGLYKAWHIWQDKYTSQMAEAFYLISLYTTHTQYSYYSNTQYSI